MRVIPPLEITPARLTSTSAIESYTIYNPTINYSLGARVLDSTESFVYESVISDNISRPLDLNETPAWLEVAKTTLALPAAWVSSTAYLVDNLVYVKVFGYYNGIPILTSQSVYRALTNNTNVFPFGTGGTDWLLIENYPVPWTLGVNYTVGRLVTDVDGRTFQSMIYPNKSIPVDNQIGWIKLYAANKRAMFEYTGSTRTVATSPLTVTLTPAKRIDSINLSGMVNVKTVRIQISSGGSSVYDQTIDMVKRNVMNYYDWFFQPFVYKKSIAKFDLPPYNNGVITLTFTSALGNVEVGSCIVGSQFYVGQTQYNALRDYTNYSTVQREFDGSIARLVQRQGIPRTQQTVWVEKANVQALSDLLLSLDATPAAWNGIDDVTDGYFEPINIVGFVKSAPIDISYPTHAVCNIELEAISSN